MHVFALLPTIGASIFLILAFAMREPITLCRFPPFAPHPRRSMQGESTLTAPRAPSLAAAEL